VSSIPDTFLESGCFLDEKLAEAEVPVIKVSAFDCLEKNLVIDMQKKDEGSIPGAVKG
jgi:hypothetical protein